MLKKIVPVVTLLACMSGTARAQNLPGLPDNSTSSQRPENPIFGSPAEEMRHRSAIRHEEATHKELLERAEEAAQLCAELRTTYARNKSFSREDLKKLERIEKLARKIRSGAGGSEDEEGVENLPPQLDAALEQLETLSEKLNQSVHKTSRLVISAAVIERSNEVIELVRHIRTFAQP